MAREVWSGSIPPAGGCDSERGIAGGRDHVYRCQNMVVQIIVKRPTMERCLVAEWRRGPRVFKWWQEQDGLDAGGMRTTAWEAEWTEGDEETDGREMET